MKCTVLNCTLCRTKPTSSTYSTNDVETVLSVVRTETAHAARLSRHWCIDCVNVCRRRWRRSSRVDVLRLRSRSRTMTFGVSLSAARHNWVTFVFGTGTHSSPVIIRVHNIQRENYSHFLVKCQRRFDDCHFAFSHTLQFFRHANLHSVLVSPLHHHQCAIASAIRLYFLNAHV